MLSGSDEAIAASAADRQTAAEWGLVLAAAGIASRVEQDDAQWSVCVGASEVEAARAALAAYVEEKTPASLPTERPVEYGRSYAALVVAAALIGAYVLLSAYDRDASWYWRGAGSAKRILNGEIWRAVTALTLHADPAHVGANALFFALIGSALCREVGPGVGLWLMLLAGAVGNIANALWRGVPHSAVGASTAVFGGIGALAGMRFVNRYRIPGARRRAWLSLAAALGLLAMIGTSPNADVLAHLFGLLAGVGLGAALESRFTQPPSPAAQFALCTAAAAVVAAAWGLAAVRGG